MANIAQRPEMDTLLQARVTDEVVDRIRVAAAVDNVSYGYVLTQLVMKYLPEVKKTK